MPYLSPPTLTREEQRALLVAAREQRVEQRRTRSVLSLCSASISAQSL